MQYLERAIGCKYVALNSAAALNTVYQALIRDDDQLLQAAAHDQLVAAQAQARKDQHMLAWASVLLKPEVFRVQEACELLEQTAVGHAVPGSSSKALQGGHVLLLSKHDSTV